MMSECVYAVVHGVMVCVCGGGGGGITENKKQVFRGDIYNSIHCTVNNWGLT